MGGGCIAKERKEIESVTESGTTLKITWTFFFDNQNVSKLQIILLSFSLKLRKKYHRGRLVTHFRNITFLNFLKT